MSEGLRVGVLGATGALGGEVLALLSESSLPVRELVPIGTDRSLGEDVEFQGEVYPVETETPALRGMDLLLLCAPAGVSLEYARLALRAEVPCVDAAGALASSPEVTLRVGAFGSAEPDSSPLLVAPPGIALPWALVLLPLQRAAGLRRVVGTALEGASCGGRRGIETLYEESVALFNQEDLPAPERFPRPVAFDCLPAFGELEEGGATRHEAALMGALARLLEGPVPLQISHVQVPVFVGMGGTLALETERALAPAEAAEALAKAPGVELWEDEAEGLTLRAVAGRETVLVGRVREDPSREHGLLLWLAADVLRVAAANALRLAVTRLGLHH